jgi:plasmid replication initiation protein
MQAQRAEELKRRADESLRTADDLRLKLLRVQLDLERWREERHMTTAERKTVETPGRRFYDEQIALLRQDSIDELIDQHYQQDAVLIAFTKVIQGHAALKEHFRAYLKSLDQFVETEDTIFFEATVRTAMGQVKVYDAFVLSEGKATHHFTGVK